MDLPMTFKERQWLLTVEAAVVPGHGQVSGRSAGRGGREQVA